MEVNVAQIKRRLFDCAKEKLVNDYNLNMPATPDELAKGVLQSLDQKCIEDPLDQHWDNNYVFRAAVYAIGSNSRPWRTFLNNKHYIEEELSQFCLEEIQRCPPSPHRLAELLTGQTKNRDALAILRWANVLVRNENYYERIKQISNEIECLAGSPPRLEYGFLCTVAHFTNFSKRTNSLKWPGMGFALGSEFLRNLHWDGFKPDRHIKRLLERWVRDQIDVRDRVEELNKIIGRADKGLSENLRWSLVGIEITPEGMSFSQVDNLVWLLGAYVEKKGRESGIDYMFS